MRVRTRLLILKLALAAALLAAVLAAMHFLLPRLTRRGGSTASGGGQIAARAGLVRATVPCDGRGVPAGAGLAQQLARQLDGFLKAFCGTHGPYASALGAELPRGPVEVHVFASHAEALAFTRGRMKQDLADPGGFYDPAAWTLAATLRPYRELLGLLFRLAGHALMEQGPGAQAQWSSWLFEGLAGEMEQGAYVQPTLRINSLSRRDAAVVLALAARNAHVPLHMLVRGGDGLFRGPLGPVAEREAALLVSFLMYADNHRHRDAFLRYVQLERQPGPAPPGALESTLGVPLNELEKEWLVFLHGVVR